MDNTITALKNLYTALGGNVEDVADKVVIPDLINAIAEQAGGLSVTAELPESPSANGTYNLQCVKSNSGSTISWKSA